MMEERKFTKPFVYVAKGKSREARDDDLVETQFNHLVHATHLESALSIFSSGKDTETCVFDVNEPTTYKDMQTKVCWFGVKPASLAGLEKEPSVHQSRYGPIQFSFRADLLLKERKLERVGTHVFDQEHAHRLMILTPGHVEGGFPPYDQYSDQQYPFRQKGKKTYWVRVLKRCGWEHLEFCLDVPVQISWDEVLISIVVHPSDHSKREYRSNRLDDCVPSRAKDRTCKFPEGGMSVKDVTRKLVTQFLIRGIQVPLSCWDTTVLPIVQDFLSEKASSSMLKHVGDDDTVKPEDLDGKMLIKGNSVEAKAELRQKRSSKPLEDK
jgi:hypothetical protein